MLTQKTPLDVAELVTIKSVSLSNSHISRAEKLSTKAVLKVSIDGVFSFRMASTKVSVLCALKSIFSESFVFSEKHFKGLPGNSRKAVVRGFYITLFIFGGLYCNG
jgi:hypothetical protein